jgi:hypothetical protein
LPPSFGALGYVLDGTPEEKARFVAFLLEPEG